jgi:hypothetical protein
MSPLSPYSPLSLPPEYSLITNSKVVITKAIMVSLYAICSQVVVETHLNSVLMALQSVVPDDSGVSATVAFYLLFK